MEMGMPAFQEGFSSFENELSYSLATADFVRFAEELESKRGDAGAIEVLSEVFFGKLLLADAKYAAKVFELGFGKKSQTSENDQRGFDFLYQALKKDSFEHAKAFLDSLSDSEAKRFFSSRKNGPLGEAAWQGNGRAVLEMLRRGADVLEADMNGNSPFHAVSQKLPKEALEAMLAHPNAEGSLSRYDSGKMNAVQTTASINMDGTILRSMLEKFPHLAHAAHSENKTYPILMASRADNLAAFEVLLEFGVDPFDGISEMMTPMIAAATNMSMKVGKRILELATKGASRKDGGVEFSMSGALFLVAKKDDGWDFASMILAEGYDFVSGLPKDASPIFAQKYSNWSLNGKLRKNLAVRTAGSKIKV